MGPDLMGVGGFSRYEDCLNGKRTLDFLKYCQHGSTVKMDILSSFVHVSCLSPPPPRKHAESQVTTVLGQAVLAQPGGGGIYCHRKNSSEKIFVE